MLTSTKPTTSGPSQVPNLLQPVLAVLSAVWSGEEAGVYSEFNISVVRLSHLPQNGHVYYLE